MGHIFFSRNTHKKTLSFFNIYFTATLFLLGFSPLSQSSESLDFVNQFDAFIEGDFSAASSDIHGKLAAGGDVQLSNYGVASQITSAPEEYTLIVGGSLTYGSGKVFTGSILVGGDGSGISDAVRNSLQSGAAIIDNAKLPFSFYEEFNALKALSETLSQLDATGGVEYQWGGAHLTGDCESETQVFNLDGNQILNSHTFALTCVPDNATIIFNFSGYTSGFKNVGLAHLNSHASKIIYNFYEAQNVEFTEVGVEGTVLAPYAHLENPRGSINGTVIAKSWNGPMEIHHYPFDGTIDVDNSDCCLTDNQAPQIISTPIGTGEENQNYEYDVEAVDTDAGDILTYELTSAPTGMAIDSATGLINWLPPMGSAGLHDVAVQVQDRAGLTAEQSYSLSITRGNSPPVITSTAITSGEVGTRYTYDVEATDDDNDELTYSLVDAPGFLSIDPASGIISGVPEQTGSFSITIDVTDQQAHDQQTYVLVIDTNNAPVFTTTPITVVDEQSAYQYDSDAIDPDDDLLIYRSVKGPEGLGIDSGNGIVSWFADANYAQSIDAPNTRCKSSPPDVGVFDPVVKYHTLAGINVISTPMVINLTDDNGDLVIDQNDIPDIVLPTMPGNQFAGGTIWAVSGSDGSRIFETTPDQLIASINDIAVGDIDLDGLPEIVAAHNDGRHLVAFEHTGELKWISTEDVLPGRNDSGGTISIANLDASGPPEVIVGASVYNAEGVLIGDGRDLGGTTGFNYYTAISAVADIDLDGRPEIIAGSTAYRLESGQLVKIWQRDDVIDGFIGIGNFDGDDYAEIVIVGSGKVQLLNHDGTNTDFWNSGSGAAVDIPGGGYGGAPTLADVNNDGLLEIGVAGKGRYVVFTGQGNILWESPTQDISSSVTGSTAFDFEGDGFSEIVYRDERFLRVYRGTDGHILMETRLWSGTATEQPVIVDIDNDGHAEIVVCSDRRYGGTAADTGIYVLEDANDSWVNTRRIWNQHAYSITNVNEDGTIPTNPAPSWLSHNTFRLNTFPDHDPLGLPDLRVGDIALDSSTGTLSVVISNIGLAPISDSVAINFYNRDPDQGGTLLGTSSIDSLASSEQTNVTLQVAAAEVTEDIVVRINESQGVNECQYVNNQTRAALVELTAEDPQGLSDQQAYLLNVHDVNEAPRILNQLGDDIEWPSNNLILNLEFEGDFNDSTEYGNHAEVDSRSTGVGQTVAGGILGEALFLHDGLVWLRVPDSDSLTVTDAITMSAWVKPTGQIGNNNGVFFKGELIGQQPDWQLNLNDVGTIGLASRSGAIASINGTGSSTSEAVVVDSDYLKAIPQNVWTHLAVTYDRNELRLYTNGVLVAAEPWSQPINSSGTDLYIGNRFQASGDGGGFQGVMDELRLYDVALSPAEIAQLVSRKVNPILVGSTFEHQVIAKDNDTGDMLTYRLVNAPVGMTINAATGVIRWTPSEDQAGYHEIQVTVTDLQNSSDQQSFSLQVITGNHAPVIISAPQTGAVALQPYSYDVQASDPDGDTLTYSLTQSPSGMSIDANTGLIQWTPDADGTFPVTVAVSDGTLQAIQDFTLTVVLPNLPPEITSTPSTRVLQGLTYQYQLSATDPEGDSISYALTTSPSGMQIDSASGLISWTPTADQIGSHNIEVSATDTQENSATQSYLLTVTTSEGNKPPEIISTPAGNAIIDQAYSYDVEALDSDNDPLSYSLTAAPAGMAIVSATGVITWTPQSSQTGAHTVEIRVEDGRGGYAIQSFGLVVSDGSTTNSLPEIQSQPGRNARNNQNYTYQIVASDADGDSLSYTLIEGPAGMSLSTTGRLAWTPTRVETVPVRVRVSDGQGYVDQAWNVQVLDAADSLSATLSIQPASVAEGETVTLQVIVQNAIDPLSIALTVDGDPVTLDSNHSAQLTASGIGSHAVEATVTDQYETVTENGSFQVIDPNSTTHPVVTIIGPVDGSEITAPTEIVATIEDDDLSVWELWLIPPSLETIDLSQATLLASDTNTPNNQVIAEFDPTLLMNGQHRLYLRAIDAGGNEGHDFSVVQVTGDMKLGHFSITFKDLEVPLAGIPITITRTYDTRRRNESLDFGQGWSVGYQDMFVRESRPAGFNWFLDSHQSGPLGVLTTYCVRPYQDNIVTVTRPDGEVERFRAVASPECNEAVPRLDVEIVFEALDGTDSTLEALDNNAGRLVNQHLVDPGMPDTPLDISRYRLTTREGVIYNLEQGEGIRTLSVPSGETLTFGNDGITHSNGAAVSFVRDATGRIERIEAPDGATLQYVYNATDDLISFTDQAAATSTYAYISDHYLQDIFDARGERAIRNLYDSDGRLIGQIDADGNRIDYVYDLAGRSQSVTDRRGNSRILVFNDRGDILAETNALGETHQRTYNAYGDELSHTDPLGNVTVSTYDNHGNQLSETDPLGRTTTNTYSRYNQLETETAPDGRVTSFGYRNYSIVGGVRIDKKGPLVSMTDGLNQTTGIGYDISGYLPLSVTDAQGNITRYGYDSQGRMNRETAPDGSVTEYSHDAMGRVLSETRSRTDNGATLTEVTRHDYDAAGRRISTTDPLGNTTRTEYDEAGQVSAEIDALGKRTEYRYDARGNQTETHYPDGSRELRGYDPENNLIAQTDRAGQTTQMVYDAANRLIETIHPDATPNDDSDNPRSRNEYDAAGRLITEIDPLGKRTEHAYNEVGQRISTTDAQGNVTRFEYDVHGNRTAMIDALNRRTEYTFDAADRMIEVSYADSSTTHTGYDALGRRTSETDQGTISTQYAYDGQGRLTQVSDALGGTTRYSYDEQGNKLTQTDAEGRTTSWTYDALGRVLSRTLPLGQQEQFVYDANGNLTSHTDFNGDTTVHQYDNNNRLIQSDYADGTVEVNRYDAQGNRSQIEVTHPDDSQETTLYSYDANNRLESEVQPDGSVLSYQYDAGGNRTQLHISLADGGSRTTDYAYDSLNRLERVTDATGSTTYGYDAVGNRTSVSYPNGSSEVYQYDSLNRLTRKETYNGTGALIRAYDYTLHATGRRTGIEELNGRTTSYGYDDLYRLTSETISDSQNGDYSASYQYDAVGNRTYSTVDGVQTAYTYDDNDRLTQQGGTRYTYDANGNTLTETLDTNTVTYGYNAKNELVSVEQGGNTTEYGYNPNGIRTRKTESGTTTSYIVDENRDYAQVLIEDDGTSQVSYTYGDDLISQERSGEAYYYHYDGLGSTRSLTDSQGNLANTYDYEAFGEVLGQTGTVENGYLFAGEQFDSSLDQYYLRARYYDPSQGRFTQQDSWMGNNQDPITLHKYLYANANPGNMIDPSGNFSMGSMMSAINIMGTLSTIATTTYDVFKFASGDSEMSASELGSEIILGLFTKGLGGSVDKIKKFLPKRFREQLEDCFSNSFVAGTLVETRNGLVPIERIQIGDEVLSQNMTSGEIEYQKVIHLIQDERDYEIYSFYLTGDSEEVIKATANHPLFANGNWVEAVDIQKGDLLSLSDGETLEVLRVSVEHVTTKVYNLTVDENHTYFVGKQRVLVHNTNFLCNFGKIRLERPLRSSDLGISGYVRQLRGKFALEDGKAIYQIDYISSANSRIPWRTVLENMKKNARNRGAKTLRIEATIANDELLPFLNRFLGNSARGSSRYQDVWEIPL